MTTIRKGFNALKRFPNMMNAPPHSMQPMKRPRNHELEDLSLAALRNTIPAAWVVHEFKNDYGIDVQLEVFDSSGHTTGLRAYVQLKATDNAVESDVLSLDKEHFEYWASHSDPVLLVRFFAGSQIIKWGWMHDLEWRIRPDASSVDVSSHLELWNVGETPDIVEKFLLLRRNVKTGAGASPLTITARNATEGIRESLKLAELIADRVPHAIFSVIGESSSPCHMDLYFEAPHLRLNYVGLPGFVFAVEKNASIESIADMAALQIFLTLFRYKKIVEAREMGLKSASVLLRATPEGGLPLLFEGLMYAMGVQEATSLILDKLIDKKDPVVWFILHAVGLRMSKHSGQEDKWRKQLVEWAESPPYAEMAASAAYNAANALQNASEWAEAIKFYELARIRDPQYSERHYYWSELGACQFEADIFSDSAASYQTSYRLKPDPSILWRLGDALFHSGQYEAAQNNLQRAITEDPALELTARLVKMICDELVLTWGIKQQEIKELGGSLQDELMALEPAHSREELIAKLSPYLSICAIDPLMSFNAGNLAGISMQPDIAMHRYLTCALRQRWDAEAWARAIGYAFQLKDLVSLALLIDVAYFYIREKLVQAVLTTINFSAEMTAGDIKQVQKQLVEMIRTAAIKQEKSMTLRVHGNDGTTEFEMN
jgi:tetratricopeptide (TPR) repeat protein